MLLGIKMNSVIVFQRTFFSLVYLSSTQVIPLFYYVFPGQYRISMALFSVCLLFILLILVKNCVMVSIVIRQEHIMKRFHCIDMWDVFICRYCRCHKILLNSTPRFSYSYMALQKVLRGSLGALFPQVGNPALHIH